jgi:hypothetical protein
MECENKKKGHIINFSFIGNSNTLASNQKIINGVGAGLHLAHLLIKRNHSQSRLT